MKIRAIAIALGLVVGCAGLAHALPMSNIAGQKSAVQKVTFWGHPFPYGYAWSRVRACTRYVPVETPSGVRYQRTWVCNTAGAVVRYRY